MPSKKSAPKISVCMPAQNAELWIAESIQSIIDQSFKDWELIIVDDGSTDATPVIIQHFVNKDDRIKAFGIEDRKGIGHARNVAAGLSSGKIICVQDADDVSHRDRLKNTWAFFKRHPKVDLTYGACQYIDPLSKPFHVVQAEPFDFQRLKKENWIQHPTVAYRAEAFEEIQYRPECRVIDDWFLYFDFHKAGKKIQPMTDVLSFYRVLPTSVSRSKEKADLVNATKELFLKEAAAYEDSRPVGK